jgi:hypothetical protein
MRIAIFGAIALLSACVTASEIVPLGQGKYSVTAGSHTMGPNGLGESRSEVLKRANAHCAAQGKQITVDSLDNQQGVDTYSSSLTFHCVGAQ